MQTKTIRDIANTKAQRTSLFFPCCFQISPGRRDDFTRQQLGKSQTAFGIGMMVVREVRVRQSIRIIKELTSVRLVQPLHKGFKLGLHDRGKKSAVSRAQWRLD